MKRLGLGLFLALPVFVLFPVLSGQTQFFYRDVTRQYQPIQAQLDHAWERRELPLWNESTQSGVPLLANLHAGALAPWGPVFRLLPFHRAYGLMVALAWGSWMAGLFVFMRRRLPLGAAGLGALMGGLAGVVLGATSYLPFLAGLACIPWQLAALHQPRRPRVTILAVLFALQVLMGDPSTALMGGLACLLAGWLDRPSRGGSSLIAASAWALGLSAIQLLPSWTLYQESSRASSSLQARLGWSFHPARLLEWVVRLPYGQLLEPPYFARWDLAPGPDAQPFLLEHGLGVLAVLMLGAALTRPGPLRRVGLALAGLGFFLSLGGHLGPLQQLFGLPPFSLFRFPERYGALTALGAAVLTAHGAGALLDERKLRARWGAAWLAMSGLLVIAAPWLGETTKQATFVTAALWGGAGVAALLSSHVRWAWLLAVLCVGALDGVRAVRASVLTLPAEALPRMPLEQGPGSHRVWRENAPLRALEQPVRGRDGFARERRLLHATFASATPGLHGIDELGGYSPVALRRWQRVLQAAAGRPLLLASLFDVCWFVSTRARAVSNPEWRLVRELAPETALYETSACRGRAWTVSTALQVASTEEAVQLLTTPGFDPATVASREGGEPLPRLAQTAVELRPRSRASELELTLQPSAQWALVAVSESWAPGWRAFVDGVERPVELLDGALLGVAVPPAGKAVTLRYEEPLGSTGLAISVATALLLLLWRRAHPDS